MQYALCGNVEREVGAAIDDLFRHGKLDVAEEARGRVGFFENARDRRSVFIEPLDSPGRSRACFVDRQTDPVELDLATIDLVQNFEVVPVFEPLQLVLIVGAVVGAFEDALDIAPLPRPVSELFQFTIGLTGTFDDLRAATEPVRPRLRRRRFAHAERRSEQQK